MDNKIIEKRDFREVLKILFCCIGKIKDFTDTTKTYSTQIC